MRGWRRPALAWLALAVYLAPAPALAQATKAGVVTTLEGNVTAARALAPQPVALKFKDDVYLQDRVVAGEQSFARLLLGGKAVVSIRERSAVTITEIPGRSTIDLESGKIALSVARDRMRPGEVINIKMPNAVAGVRGTVVIAEVSHARVGGAQQATSSLAVLRGQVEVVHTNAGGAAIGAPLMLGAMQKFSATPTTASIGTFTVEQIASIVEGLQSKGVADPGTASQAPAQLEAVNTAVALLSALTGSPAVTQLATGTSPEITTPTDSTPEPKITEAGDITASPVFPSGAQLPQLSPSPPPVNTTTLQSGQNLLTLTDSEVQSSDGTPIDLRNNPLLSRTRFTITQVGPDDLVVAKPDATVELEVPLLKLTDTTVQAGDAFFSVAGSVTSRSTQPFIDLDPTTVTAPGNLVEIIGPAGVLTLAGTLVRDTGGTMNVDGSILAVSDSTLTSSGKTPLVQFNGSFVNAHGVNGAVLRLDTALLDASAPIFLLTSSARLQTSADGIVLVNNAQLQSDVTNDALVRIDNQARMDVLAGHLVSVSASRLNVSGDLLRVGSNTLLNVTNGVLLSVLNGGIANINGALVNFTGMNGLINVTNNLAPTAFIGGVPVFVAQGGNMPVIGQEALTGLNVNGNTIRINGTALPTSATQTSGITGSLISVGANGSVRVGGGLN